MTTADPTPVRLDERLASIGIVTRVLKRPDTGAFIGAVAVFVLFAITARQVNWAGDLGVWCGTSLQSGKRTRVHFMGSFW